MNEILAGAIAHARRGSPVFPCDPQKKTPRTPHGFHDATTDEDKILEQWKAQPDSAIGLPTGRVSGIVALDVDGPDGEESLLEWQERNGKLPPTTEVLTPHGRHLYFRHPGNGGRVPCAAPLKGYVGLDVRGDGGYVITAPSPGYVFEVSSDGMADVPAALVEEAQPEQPKSEPTPAAPLLWGARNTSLASLAGSMRARGMTETAIRAALLAETSRAARRRSPRTRWRRSPRATDATRLPPVRDCARARRHAIRIRLTLRGEVVRRIPEASARGWSCPSRAPPTRPARRPKRSTGP